MTAKKLARDLTPPALYRSLSRLRRALGPPEQILVDSTDRRSINARHESQNLETVLALQTKYADPVFGLVDPEDLLDRLALCVDPSDGRLLGISQHVHVQQMLLGMEEAGEEDEDLYFAALIHDMGKILLLTDEDPANVVGMNSPIGEHPAKVGLDNVAVNWNHDEFMWSRLAAHVPDHIAWLVRYHSLEIPKAHPYMDERDLDYLARFLTPFRHYDQDTKSIDRFDSKVIERWKPLLRERLPERIMV